MGNGVVVQRYVKQSMTFGFGIAKHESGHGEQDDLPRCPPLKSGSASQLPVQRDDALITLRRSVFTGMLVV